MRTLPLALQSLAGGAGAATLATAGITAAASLLMTLPVVVIFVIMQRKVIETMTYAGIKG
jgi:ABC-type maltose transport system permease subunit